MAILCRAPGHQTFNSSNWNIFIKKEYVILIFELDTEISLYIFFIKVSSWLQHKYTFLTITD